MYCFLYCWRSFAGSSRTSSRNPSAPASDVSNLSLIRYPFRNLPKSQPSELHLNSIKNRARQIREIPVVSIVRMRYRNSLCSLFAIQFQLPKLNVADLSMSRFCEVARKLRGFSIVGKQIPASDAVMGLNGKPVIASDTDGNRYFKRLRVGQDRIVLESLDSAGDFPPVILDLPDGGSNSLHQVWPVAGVLFELPI